MTALHDLQIAIAKLPASDTVVAQPCDAWKLFVVMKAFFISCPARVWKETSLLSDFIDSHIAAYETKVEHKLKQGVATK